MADQTHNKDANPLADTYSKSCFIQTPVCSADGPGSVVMLCRGFVAPNNSSILSQIFFKKCVLNFLFARSAALTAN